MRLLKTLHFVKRRFSSASSLVRMSAAAMVIASLAVVIMYSIPVGNRDRRLLSQTHDADVLGLSLEGDLQSEVEESRGRFLRILLDSSNPAQWDGEIASLRRKDKQVSRTLNELILLGISAADWRQFGDTWQSYTADRDKQVAMVLQGRGANALVADNARGRASFQQVQEAVRRAKDAFDRASTERIQEMKRSLRQTAAETLSLLALTIISLFLLLWMDRQRTMTQRQLALATDELRVSEDRFRQAYESASVGMGMFSLEGKVLSANRMAAQILGYEIDELIGMKVSDFMAPECREDHLERIVSLPESAEKSYGVERRVIRKDGTKAWVRNSVTLLKSEGQIGQYFSISEEITKEKAANERLQYLAKFDPVTNLPNLHAFEAHLAEALKESVSGPDGVGLLYLEIDSFDFVKGTFGRTVANEILAEVGAGLTAFRREGEFAARLDDNVFCCQVRSSSNNDEALFRGTELGRVLQLAGESGKHRIPLSASIGFANSLESAGSSPIRDAAELLKFARAAMIEARSRGGDSIFVADQALQKRALQRHQIETALLHGLRENEFQVVYQPQFQVATGRLVRFEALCRWKSRELGTIPPDRFIPVAEQTGLISEIGRRVMEIALHQAKTWIDAGRQIGLAVNVSPMQFMRPDFPQLMRELLVNSHFPPALLELEITEGIFIRDLNLAIARIRELQRLGLTVALDDFGTGYSSLSYLQKMPIDAVKLDRSFVRDITSDPATVSMVRSVLAMADALKLRVVTEGVETEQQLEILRGLGCEEAQGYLLGRPEAQELALQRVLESSAEPFTSVA